MKSLDKILNKTNVFCGIFAEILVMFLVVLVVAEIIARILFNHPIPGQTETAQLTLVAIVYLAVSYTQMQKGHVRVEAIISRATGAKREFMEAFTMAIGLFVSLMMLWGTGERAINSVRNQEFITGAINFPVWPGRCTVVLGFFLLSLTLLSQMIQHIITGYTLISKGEDD